MGLYVLDQMCCQQFLQFHTSEKLVLSVHKTFLRLMNEMLFSLAKILLTIFLEIHCLSYASYALCEPFYLGLKIVHTRAGLNLS